MNEWYNETRRTKFLAGVCRLWGNGTAHSTTLSADYHTNASPMYLIDKITVLNL